MALSRIVLAVVLANKKEIFHHAKRVAQKTHLAVCALPPHYGDFFDAKTIFFGQKKHLHVKAKAVQALFLKKLFGRFVSKALEAALCVPKTLEQDQTHDQVKHAPRKPSKFILLDITSWLATRARSDRDIAWLFKRADQFVDLFDWSRQVHICHENKAALRGQHTASNRGSFASIFFHSQELDAIAAERTDFSGCLVRRAIIGHQDLPFCAAPLKKTLDAPQGLPDALFFVKDRDHH